MILAKKIFDTLKKNKVSFFTGVPDSVLKNLSNYFGKLKKNKSMSNLMRPKSGSLKKIAKNFMIKA